MHAIEAQQLVRKFGDFVAVPQTRCHIWQYLMKLRQQEGVTMFIIPAVWQFGRQD